MSKKNIVIVVVLVLVIIFIGFLVYRASNTEAYSVVYLTSGEVYIGKLTKFPDFQLKDGYILQVTKDPKDPTKNNFQLNPLKDALWSPEALHLIKDNIVFYGPITSESKIAQTLASQIK